MEGRVQLWENGTALPADTENTCGCEPQGRHFRGRCGVEGRRSKRDAQTAQSSFEETGGGLSFPR